MVFKACAGDSINKCNTTGLTMALDSTAYRAFEESGVAVPKDGQFGTFNVNLEQINLRDREFNQETVKSSCGHSFITVTGRWHCLRSPFSAVTKCTAAYCK